MKTRMAPTMTFILPARPPALPENKALQGVHDFSLAEALRQIREDTDPLTPRPCGLQDRPAPPATGHGEGRLRRTLRDRRTGNYVVRGTLPRTSSFTPSCSIRPFHGSREAHGQQHQIGVHCELGPGHGFEFWRGPDPDAVELLYIAVFVAGEMTCCDASLGVRPLRASFRCATAAATAATASKERVPPAASA